MLSQIHGVLRNGRDGPKLSERQVAERLFCSESTLRRRLRQNGTTFSRERNAVRAQVAFDLLQRQNPAYHVARRVGVTADHLGVIMRQAYGLSPRRISLIARVADRLREEPSSLREFEAAQRDDVLLQELLADIDACHPLGAWAKGLVTLGFHPERETVEYRNELRKRERAAFEEKRHRVEAEVVMTFSFEELSEIDFGALLEEKHHSRAHMLHAVRKRRERVAKKRAASRPQAQ